MKNPKPASISDIAKIARVNHSTVSRALNGHPKVARKTREEIVSIARRLEYKPNPFFKALAARRIHVARSSPTSVVAYLLRQPLQTESGNYLKTFIGAQERTESLGYKIDTVWLNEPGMTSRRLSEILISRGIKGLLVGLLGEQKKLELEWQHFASVAIGFSIVHPPLHKVCDDYYFSMTQVLQRVRAQGYQRPAFVISSRQNELSDKRWLSGFLLFMEEWMPGRKPLYFISPATRDNDHHSSFMSWLKSLPDPPDVFIFTGRLNTSMFLSDKKSEFLRSYSVALLSKFDEKENFSGMKVNFHELGSMASTILINLLQSNQFGVPECPHTLYIPGTWDPGITL